MKTAGVREFKAKLSRYLEDVRRGEVILVTDRGEVVAEVRLPQWPGAEDHRVRALWPLVARGELGLGDPSREGSTRRAGVASGISTGRVDAALAGSRAEEEPPAARRRRR
jgi:antitoxin (DNA-binding transcriptional repressor) of toxin-antitoxin stability system